MPSRDPAEWFHDLSVHVDDKELLEEAASLERTLLHDGSRIGLAIWTILVSAIGGAFSGFTFSDEVRSSWLIFVSYLVAAALVLRVRETNRELAARTCEWRATQHTTRARLASNTLRV